MNRLRDRAANSSPIPLVPGSATADDGLSMRTVSFQLNGERVEAVSGQSLAAALHAHGHTWWRRNPVTGQPRGPFCGMGVCFECELDVDGELRRACVTHVTDGMIVRTGKGAPDAG